MSEIRTYRVEWTRKEYNGGKGTTVVKAYDARDAAMQVRAAGGKKRILAVEPYQEQEINPRHRAHIEGVDCWCGVDHSPRVRF